MHAANRARAMPASELAVSNHQEALANSSSEKCGARSLHFRSPTRLAECDAEDLDAFPPIESLRRSPASAERRRRSSWPVGRELPRDSTKEEHQMSPFGR